MIGIVIAVIAILVAFFYLWWMRSLCTDSKKCIPKCVGKTCNQDDGCGNKCPCPNGQKCNENGQCIDESCVPKCDGKTCGPDGCGGVCGKCGNGEFCGSNSTCIIPPPPSSEKDKPLNSGQYLFSGPNNTWLVVEEGKPVLKALDYQDPKAIWAYFNNTLHNKETGL